MNRRGVLVALCVFAVLILASCGETSAGKEAVATDRPSSPTTPTAGSDAPIWIAVMAAGDAREVRVVVSGADPSLPSSDPCAEEFKSAVKPSPEAVTITVRRAENPSGDQCIHGPRSVTVELGSVLGSRLIVNGLGDQTYAPGPGGGYYQQPQVAMAPPAVPAACTVEAYGDAIQREIDGGNWPVSNVRCDGTFLALDIDQGADACAPGLESCAGERVQHAYFVNLNGAWRIASYSTDMTCATLAENTGITFPPALC